MEVTMARDTLTTLYLLCFFFEDRRAKKDASSQMLTKFKCMSFINADLKECSHSSHTFFTYEVASVLYKSRLALMLLYEITSAYYCPENVSVSLPHIKLYDLGGWWLSCPFRKYFFCLSNYNSRFRGQEKETKEMINVD